MPITQRDIMGGLAKGLTVIETYSAERPRQSISEVAAHSGLDRATARRCLLTLAHLGYADYDGKFFTLTPRVMRLGAACLATMPMPKIVQPWLEQLSEELGESVSVSILDDDEIVYVARAAQRKVMSISLAPASRLPAYCTSMGRILLAALPAEDAASLLTKTPLPKRTPRTITEPEVLIAEIGRISSQGYALIDQEVEMGLRSIAVPVFDAHGRTTAALNIGLPVVGDNAEDMVKKYLPALLKIQTELKSVLI